MINLEYAPGRTVPVERVIVHCYACEQTADINPECMKAWAVHHYLPHVIHARFINDAGEQEWVRVGGARYE